MAILSDFDQHNDNKGQNNQNGGGNPHTTGFSAQNLGAIPFEEQDVVTEHPLLTNYNDEARAGRFDAALFRDEQIRQVVTALTQKKKPNPLLVGDAGVGKTQIVEEIARRLVNSDPIISRALKNVTLFELPVWKLVSGSKFQGELEQKVESVIAYAEDPDNNIVLFIDEIHQIMGVNGSNPAYDKIAQMLKPALSRGRVRIIGATTTQEAVGLMSDPAFSRRWTDVHVPELSVDETETVLKHVMQNLQKHHDVLVPEEFIGEIVLVADSYKKYGSHRPDNAITLLDRSLAEAHIRRLELEERAKTEPLYQNVLKNQPKAVLSLAQVTKTAQSLISNNQNVFSAKTDELATQLDTEIVGQAKAKEVITDTIRRINLRLTKQTRPNSFLFAGPSGTGKTEIAKQLAKALYGAKSDMITINMSEYAHPSSLNRIVGSPVGYVGSESRQEFPFDSLETNPYQIILLDEFEKADTVVQRFFMQALDEGTVMTNRNKPIDFSRAIIIATTNAGAVEMVKAPFGFTTGDEEPSKNDVIKSLNHAFDTELLNRFEHIVQFESITKMDYLQILAIKYNQIVPDIQKNRRDIDISPASITPEDALINETLLELVEQSYSGLANGRPAERTIRAHIEDTILNNANLTRFTLL